MRDDGHVIPQIHMFAVSRANPRAQHFEHDIRQAKHDHPFGPSTSTKRPEQL